MERKAYIIVCTQTFLYVYVHVFTEAVPAQDAFRTAAMLPLLSGTSFYQALSIQTDLSLSAVDPWSGEVFPPSL